jgi:hypothetical protein
MNIIGGRPFLFENLELDSDACPGPDPGFAGEKNLRKGLFLFVIPAKAGIQEDLKMKSMSR